jgi:hypothetical protein
MGRDIAPLFVRSREDNVGVGGLDVAVVDEIARDGDLSAALEVKVHVIGEPHPQ